MSAKILIVDDEYDIRNLIRGILEDEGYKTCEAESSSQAYQAMETEKPDLMILDIWLHGSEQDGLEILSRIKQEDPGFPIIMISGHGNIETAITCIKQGAYDFIEKPFKSNRLLLMIQRGLESANLKRENQALRNKTNHKSLTAPHTAQTESPPQSAQKSSLFSSIDFTTCSLKEAREMFEREYLKIQIDRFGGNISKTAEFIGMERSALHRKLKTLRVSQLRTKSSSAPANNGETDNFEDNAQKTQRASA